MDMGMKYIYTSSHMPLHMVELQIKRNDVKHFKNVFLWPSGMHINQSDCAVTVRNHKY